MDDPEILISLGKMNKKDFSILEPDRIRMIVECAGNEKLSEFPYEKLRKYWQIRKSRTGLYMFI